MGLISFFRHTTFGPHESPSMHPEGSDPLLAIDNAIAASPVAGSLIKISPRLARDNELCAVHHPSYIEQVERAAEIATTQNRLRRLDGDALVSSTTLHDAKLAAGAGLKAVESLADEKISSAFIAARPSGHHALSTRQMGLCIYNNVALAASYARRQLGYKRVLIIDWDVHHGNGTQEIFYHDPGVFFISLHQYPHWPYDSGWYTEHGAASGKGFNLNIPLPAGTGDSGYLAAWDRIIMPVSLEYNPDIILVSAGYGAHRDDPMSGQRVTSNGFGLLSERLRSLSEMTNAKSACFLEGGNNMNALAESVVNTLGGLSKIDYASASASRDSRQATNKRDKTANAKRNTKQITADQSPAEVEERLSQVSNHFGRYWMSLR